jgi:hypothetical protein
MTDISDKLNYSDFDIYRVNLPDGSSYVFDDEDLFDDFCRFFSDSVSSFKDSVIAPSPLSVAVASSLGVSTPPVLSSWG